MLPPSIQLWSNVLVIRDTILIPTPRVASGFWYPTDTIRPCAFSFYHICFEIVSGGNDHFTDAIILQRHITRQKILNWRQSLKFPSRPHVSPAGVDLMKQLLCEPEDRLGSQASSSVSRPNSLVVQNRRSGFFNFYGGRGSVDGAELIKVRNGDS